MNSELEFLHVAFLTSVNSRSHESVLDDGAQSFVVGLDTLRRHAVHLRNSGIHWQLMCAKPFFPCAPLLSNFVQPQSLFFFVQPQTSTLT